jgi:hypothetical protein
LENPQLTDEAEQPEASKDSKDQLMRLQQRWKSRISREKEAHKEFRKRAAEIELIFRVDVDECVYDPLFWSVVGVEHVGVYSNQPTPVRPQQAEPGVPAVSAGLPRRPACIDDNRDDTFHRSIDDFLAMGLVAGGIGSVIPVSWKNRSWDRPMGQMMGQMPGPVQVRSAPAGQGNQGRRPTLRWGTP